MFPHLRVLLKVGYAIIRCLRATDTPNSTLNIESPTLIIEWMTLYAVSINEVSHILIAPIKYRKIYIHMLAL